MERSSRAWLAVGIALSVAALTWAFWPRPVAVEVAEVVRGPFEATVDEEGKTRLRERYVVSAPLAGRLARVALREGDAVEAGARTRARGLASSMRATMPSVPRSWPGRASYRRAGLSPSG